MNIFKKNTEKHTEKLPMTGKVKKGFRIYCTAIMGAALVLGTSVTAFAANDPITVINNLSTFIFGLIRAIGLILLGLRRCADRSVPEVPRPLSASERFPDPCRRRHHYLCKGNPRPHCRLSLFTPWGVPGFSGTPPIL